MPSTSDASATASAAALAARAVSSAASSDGLSDAPVSRVAADLGRASLKAREIPWSAEVTSLGITQNVLPVPWASCGSTWRYW
jgi:hypothetical protein